MLDSQLLATVNADDRRGLVRSRRNLSASFNDALFDGVCDNELFRSKAPQQLSTNLISTIVQENSARRQRSIVLKLVKLDA
jgi:hypothetical protein